MSSDLFRGVCVFGLVFLAFIELWKVMILTNNNLDPQKNKEIAKDRKLARIFQWMIKKEDLFISTKYKIPYLEAKLYKKSYILGIINFISCAIEIFFLIIYFVLVGINQEGFFLDFSFYITICIIVIDVNINIAIYLIEEYKYRKSNKR